MKTCPSCNNLNPSDAAACSRCGGDLAGGVAAPGGAAPVIGPGSVLGGGRYQLDALLGEGGMGSVYRSTDTRLNREVALKILSGGLLQHEQARARMSREAQALARIEHRNVVQIRDVFDDGPYLVLVLELVTGGDLRGRIERGALEEAEAIRIMDGMLAGLSALHGAGLIHRDIKPGNILLTEDGVPKVTDLGIAHDGQGRSMTRTGAQLGTVHYMAPEQIKGGSIDARTDVYASGVVLFELLTGQPPFDGTSDWEIQTAHVQHAPDTSVLEGQTSPHVLSAIECALEKEPADRWQTTESMRTALLEPGQAPARKARQSEATPAPKATSKEPSQTKVAPQAPKNRRADNQPEDADADSSTGTIESEKKQVRALKDERRVRARKGQGPRPEFAGRETRGTFFKARREWLGMTQIGLAGDIGYSHTPAGVRKISAWEHGGDVSRQRVLRFAKALQIERRLIEKIFPEFARSESDSTTVSTSDDANGDDDWGCGCLVAVVVGLKVIYWLSQI